MCGNAGGVVRSWWLGYPLAEIPARDSGKWGLVVRCAWWMSLGLAAACWTGGAEARAVDRARLDALIAEADKVDPTGDPAGYLRSREAALAEARRIYPAGHPEIAVREQERATGLAAAQRFDEAVAILDRITPVLEKAGPAYAQSLRDAIDVNGYIATFRSDHARAVALFERVVASYRADGKPGKGHATALSNLAAALWEAGDSSRALDLNRAALDMAAGLDPRPADGAMWYANRMVYLRGLGRMEEAVEAGQDGLLYARGLVPDSHPLLANINANTAALLTQVGRPAAALPLARRAFEAVEAAAGGPNQNSAAMRAIFAGALLKAGHFEEADAFLAHAVPIIDAQLGAQSNRALQARELQAQVLSRLGRDEAAIALQQQVVAARDARLAPGHRDRMSGRATLARIAVSAGRLDLAEAAQAEGVTMRQAAVPPSHPDLLLERATLQLIRSRSGSRSPADLIAEAHAILGLLVANARRDPAAPMSSDARAAFQALAEVLQHAGDRAGAFEAQQWSARTSVDDAAAASAAEGLAEGRPEVSAALSERRGLLAERAAILGKVDAQMAAPDAKFDIAAAAVSIDAIDARVAALDASLARLAPASDIQRGRFSAIAIAEVRRRLAQGEAFVQVSPLTDRYLVTLVTAGGEAQYLTRASRNALEAKVQALRATLDPAKPEVPLAHDAASALFEALFPREERKLLRGTGHLRVSASGAFGALPFAVLMDGGRYLIDRMAISRVPGAASLARATGSGLVPALFAMGDRGVAKPGAVPANRALRGVAAGIPDLATLPGSEAELRAIASSIGAADPVILLGEGATESALRGASIVPGGVLAFATHALVSGEVEGLREPALVLTAQGQDDGLLTASEISRLNLPARWVLLSACNTAAGSGADAPGLSGLAQAFMLAGAGHILATHWPIRDDVAGGITTRFIQAVAKGGEPAQALRRAMLAAHANGARHPALWAAFELVE